MQKENERAVPVQARADETRHEKAVRKLAVDARAEALTDLQRVGRGRGRRRGRGRGRRGRRRGGGRRRRRASGGRRGRCQRGQLSALLLLRNPALRATGLAQKRALLLLGAAHLCVRVCVCVRECNTEGRVEGTRRVECRKIKGSANTGRKDRDTMKGTEAVKLQRQSDNRMHWPLQWRTLRMSKSAGAEKDH